MKYLLCCVCLMLTMAGNAEAAETAGDVKTLSGKVEVQRGAEKLSPAVGDILQVHDRIRTGADGSIGISFVDGTRLSLGPSTEIAVQDYVFVPVEGTFSFDMNLLKGSAAYVSGKLGKLAPEAVKIRTPQATIGIRGTFFVVKVD